MRLGLTVLTFWEFVAKFTERRLDIHGVWGLHREKCMDVQRGGGLGGIDSDPEY
jgi:hypothetical protein